MPRLAICPRGRNLTDELVAAEEKLDCKSHTSDPAAKFF
jgi:hypothetical protein